MLYLIGGAPRCGKTTVARQLAQRQCCSRLAADYLGTAFTNYIPATELQTRYPDWHTTTVDERYERYTTHEIITNYRTKAATTWPGLRDVLSYTLYEQHEIVVEGYHLEPAFVHELVTTHPQFRIQALFLYRTGAAQLQEDLQRSTDPQDWVMRSATQATTFERIAAMVTQYSRFFKTEAELYGFPVSSMDGSFDAGIDRAMERLLE